MTPLSPLGALLGGLLTLLAPCSVMVLPTFFAYAFTSPTKLLTRTVTFWAGLITTLVPLGAAIATVTSTLRQWSTGITLTAAVFVILLGFAQVFSVEIPKITFRRPRVGTITPTGTRAGGDTSSALSVYLLGITYGFAGVGCAGPILGAVLALAGIGGSPWTGAWLMLLYATGMAAPLAILALLWQTLGLSQKGWLRPRPLHLFGRWTTWTNVISGIILILLGLALVLIGPHNPLGTLVDPTTLAAWESAILTATSSLPWWVLLLVVLLIAGAVALVLPRRHSKTPEK